jgi:hypothetical protein
MTASRSETDNGRRRSPQPGERASGWFPRLRNRRSPGRYRRASLTTGRLQMVLAVAVIAVLLGVLAVVLLPAPVSQVALAVIVASAAFVVIADNRHEDHAGR